MPEGDDLSSELIDRSERQRVGRVLRPYRE